ncbi:MAG: response regulator [Chloroflexi bacterium]|nr:response regulator [Chloroflexota bacterium]
MINPCRVLIVDDSAAWCRNIQRILQKAGFAVTVARDPDFALQELKITTFDVAVVDINLDSEVMDGLDINRYIQNNSNNIRVILISTEPLPEYEVNQISPAIFLNKMQIAKRSISLVEAIEAVLLNHT